MDNFKNNKTNKRMNEEQMSARNGNIAKIMIDFYVVALSKMGIRHPKYNNLLDLQRNLLNSENINNDDYLIEDPLLLILLSMNEKHTSFTEIVTSFNVKVKKLLEQKSKSIVKNGGTESINDIICQYIRPSPKKIIKNINDEELCPHLRRNSAASMTRSSSRSNSVHNSPLMFPQMSRDSSYESNGSPTRDYSTSNGLGSPVMNY